MPYVSEAQRKFFNANRAELEKQGVDVDEYNAASKGKKLPEHSSKSKKKKRRTGMSNGIGVSANTKY